MNNIWNLGTTSKFIGFRLLWDSEVLRLWPCLVLDPDEDKQDQDTVTRWVGSGLAFWVILNKTCMFPTISFKCCFTDCISKRLVSWGIQSQRKMFRPISPLSAPCPDRVICLVTSHETCLETSRGTCLETSLWTFPGSALWIFPGTLPFRLFPFHPGVSWQVANHSHPRHETTYKFSGPNSGFSLSSQCPTSSAFISPSSQCLKKRRYWPHFQILTPGSKTNWLLRLSKRSQQIQTSTSRPTVFDWTVVQIQSFNWKNCARNSNIQTPHALQFVHANIRFPWFFSAKQSCLSPGSCPCLGHQTHCLFPTSWSTVFCPPRLECG